MRESRVYSSTIPDGDIALLDPSHLSQLMQDFIHLPITYDFAIDTNERTNLTLSYPCSIFGQDAIVLMYDTEISTN